MGKPALREDAQPGRIRKEARDRMLKPASLRTRIPVELNRFAVEEGVLGLVLRSGVGGRIGRADSPDPRPGAPHDPATPTLPPRPAPAQLLAAHPRHLRQPRRPLRPSLRPVPRPPRP